MTPLEPESEAGAFELAADTKAVLLAAGLIFLLALVLGVWKYRQMASSPDGLAHPYVDTAHRAALLYSFATLLIAVFVELSGWSETVDSIAAFVVIFYFLAAVGSYIWHGARRDTDNQIRDPVRGTGVFFWSLVVAEIAGFSVLAGGAYASDGSSSASRRALGIAPTMRFAGSPSLNRIIDGIERTSYLAAVCWLSSTLRLTIERSSRSASISSSTGWTTRQGPHQGAQKSTSTGPSASSTSDWKLASVTSVSLPGTLVSSSSLRLLNPSLTIQTEA